MAKQQASPVFLLWAVFLFTQIGFSLAPWAMIETVQAAGNPTLSAILPFVAVMDCALAFFLPRTLLARAAKQLPAQASDWDILRVAAPALVIQFALLEFVTLLGLVQCLVSQDPKAGLPYAALGILGTLVARPNPERLRQWLNRRPTP